MVGVERARGGQWEVSGSWSFEGRVCPLRTLAFTLSEMRNHGVYKGHNLTWVLQGLLWLLCCSKLQGWDQGGNRKNS